MDEFLFILNILVKCRIYIFNIKSYFHDKMDKTFDEKLFKNVFQSNIQDKYSELYSFIFFELHKLILDLKKCNIRLVDSKTDYYYKVQLKI